jgi:hypothetical protein
VYGYGLSLTTFYLQISENKTRGKQVRNDGHKLDNPFGATRPEHTGCLQISAPQ